jgi:hypothetical protein
LPANSIEHPMAKKIFIYFISLTLISAHLTDSQTASGKALAPKSKVQDTSSQSRMRKEYIRAILRIAQKKKAPGRYELLTSPDFLRLLLTDFIASIPPVNLKNQRQLFTSAEIEYFAHSLSWPEWIQWLIFFFDLESRFDAHFQPYKNFYRWLAFLHISKEFFSHLLPIALTAAFIFMAAIGQTWALLLIPFVIYFYWAAFLIDRTPTYRNFLLFKKSLGVTIRSGTLFLLLKKEIIKRDLSALDLLSIVLHEFSHVLPGWRETHLQDFFAFCYLALLGVSDNMKIDPLAWKTGRKISDRYYSKAVSTSDFIILYSPVIEEIRSLLIEENRDESISVPESFLSDESGNEPYAFNVALASFLCHRYYRMGDVFGKEMAEKEFMKEIMAFWMELIKNPNSSQVPVNKTGSPARARIMTASPTIQPVHFSRSVLFDMAA